MRKCEVRGKAFRDQLAGVMEAVAPQSDRGMLESSAPIGFLWASNQFANGLLQELTTHATACLALIDSLEKSEPAAPLDDLANQLETNLRICRRLIARSKRIIENIFSNSTNLNEVTDFSARLLRHVIHQNVQLELHLDPAVETLSLDIKGLEMILAVLLIRAREVMHGEGSIIIETRHTQLDAPRKTPMVRLPAGDYATLAITCSSDEDPEQEWEQWLLETNDGDSAAPSSSFVRSLLAGMGAQIDVARWPFIGAAITLYFPVSAIDVSPKPVLARDRWSGR